MKTQQLLLVIAAIVCLLVGVSSVAMAQETRTCTTGIINNETVDNIVVDGTPCHISETVILGNVIVRNSPFLGMTNNRVLGRIKITGDPEDLTGSVTMVDNLFNGKVKIIGVGGVLLKDNRVLNSPIIARESGIVWIFNNTVEGDSSGSFMRFKDNTDEVQIFNNIISGDLLCNKGNNVVFTSGNIVSGNDTCESQ